MSLGINLLMYLTEIASGSLGKNFLGKINESHHKHKKDYPSGTALMLGQGIAIGKKKIFTVYLEKNILTKKTSLSVKRLILIQLEKVKLLENMKLYFQVVKK